MQWVIAVLIGYPLGFVLWGIYATWRIRKAHIPKPVKSGSFTGAYSVSEVFGPLSILFIAYIWPLEMMVKLVPKEKAEKEKTQDESIKR